ncbi:Hypothetical predicted protein, partial [Pelobates cultripes]
FITHFNSLLHLHAFLTFPFLIPPYFDFTSRTPHSSPSISQIRGSPLLHHYSTSPHRAASQMSYVITLDLACSPKNLMCL